MPSPAAAPNGDQMPDTMVGKSHSNLHIPIPVPYRFLVQKTYANILDIDSLLPGTNFCISFFSIVMIKHHDKGNLCRNGFILAFVSRGLRVPHGRDCSRNQKAWQHKWVAGDSHRALQA